LKEEATHMDYFEPKSIQEALSLLAKYESEAKVIAGGTDVMVDIKYKEEPGCLVNIKRIPGMGEIRENGGGLGIGPLVTIREIETNKLVRERLPLLWEASHQFASLQIRNTATIGGNVCRASPSGETLAPLLVLEAKAKLAFSDGEKIQEIDSLFLGPGATTLGSKGLLTEIEVPYAPKGSRGVYLKHAVRGPMDIAMVGVAVLVVPDAANTALEEVRIGLGAVAPTPIRAAKAEAMLRSKPLTAELAQEAARLAASESSPITDQRGSAEYRRWIVEALTRRGLQQSWQAATGKEVI
jgi:carbon-monoxide dehydrogenase medium subunit